MEDEVSIDNSTNSDFEDVAQEEEGALHIDWKATDAAFLQPNTISIPRVQRAWERKPLSPFSRQRVRVGKVWKRPASSLRHPVSGATAESTPAKTRKARRTLQSPQKPVKKMCLDTNFGLSARVSQWESAESPARKIVTRSSAAVEEMVALSDEEEEELVIVPGDDNVTIEFFDKDGTLLDVDPENAEQDEHWEDEVKEDDKADGVPFNGTTAQPADVNEAGLAAAVAQEGVEDVTNGSIDVEPSKEHKVDSPVAQAAVKSEAVGSDSRIPADAEKDESMLREHLGDEQIRKTVPQRFDIVPLPEGFVSPAKRSGPRGRRSAQLALGTRRRTLPVQFAPIIAVEPPETYAVQPSHTPEEAVGESNDDDAVADSETGHTVAQEIDLNGVKEDEPAQEDGEWEDVEDGSHVPDVLQADDHVNDLSLTPEVGMTESDSAVDTMLDAVPEAAEDLQVGMDVDADQRVPTSQLQEMHARVASSPIPSIEGHHPRLPLRRSPRRQSSSPLKRGKVLPSTEDSHLIAFTPLKVPAQYPSPSRHPGLDSPLYGPDDSHPEPASPLQRAASAPPEEPKMSPLKPSKPRISDDTALLQAFLNRAAENRSSRRISADTRESIENRRDSDAVRQALASPAKTDVLVELDPNSPSPRKAAAASQDLAGGFDQVMRDATDAATQHEGRDDAQMETQTRRSGRTTRRQPTTPVAPNKISIRGNTDGVVLKRSEAQELAKLTSTNTKKNKGGAVLPQLRLTKLASQGGQTGEPVAEGEEEQQNSQPEVATKIRWAESLVEFFQSGETSESSFLSDEMSATAQLGQEEMAASEAAVAAPPPPSDTPSKPKIRRLKPPRTAATPGKRPAAPASASESDEAEKPPAPEAQDQQLQAPLNRRRSRIATPAKGLTNTSLLPADLDSQSTAAKKTPTTKKKALISKLPAPTSTATVGQGKENNTITSSPPKKKPGPPAVGGLPTARSFAPKLDFGNAKLEPATPVLVPGLASPAKKGGRGRNVAVEDEGARFKETKEEVPGLSSPAKKRTRRA